MLVLKKKEIRIYIWHKIRKKEDCTPLPWGFTPQATIRHDALKYIHKELNIKQLKGGKLQIQTLSWRVNMPHSVYAYERESACLPAALRRLHHYISAWLFYITALPVLLPARSPHHLLSTLQLSMRSAFPSLLCGFLCQPSLPSNFSWLINALRWSCLAADITAPPSCMNLNTRVNIRH